MFGALWGGLDGRIGRGGGRGERWGRRVLRILGWVREVKDHGNLEGYIMDEELSGYENGSEVNGVRL